MKLTYEEIQEIINSSLFKRIWMGPDIWFSENTLDINDLIEIQDPLHKSRKVIPFVTIKDDEIELAIEFVRKLGSYDVVTQVGGEGRGEDYYVVYYFADHDIYIKFDGWYYSYDGAEYSTMYQVWPHDVVRTEYLTTPN